MTDREEHEIPSFRLPDWGTDGAPPEPRVEDEEVGTTAVEAHELEITIEPGVLMTTADLPAGWMATHLHGLVTADATVWFEEEREHPARDARMAALEALGEEADAIGASAVLGIRLDVAVSKKAVTVTVYGTAADVSRRPARS